ncbi:MAG: hypothetical protein GWN58_34320 [Anaerolineae bacterium]|nr:hypothetical protein [Anaerolineae bacterium]
MNPEPKQKRPVGLVVIIVLQLALALLEALYLLGWKQSVLALRLLVRNPIFYTEIVGWVLAGLLLLAVLGLLLQKRWGWIISMILTGFGLFYTIWSYFQGTPRYFPMLIYVIMVLYLNQHDVQRLFREQPDPELAR